MNSKSCSNIFLVAVFIYFSVFSFAFADYDNSQRQEIINQTLDSYEKDYNHPQNQFAISNSVQADSNFKISEQPESSFKINNTPADTSFKISNNLATDPSFGITDGSSEAIENEPQPANKFEMGFEGYYDTYTEVHFIRSKGYMWGMFGSLTHRILNHNNVKLFSDDILPNVLKLDTHFDWGYMDYEGSGNIENIRDLVGEVRGLAGYDIPFKDTWLFTPYLGIGYRYLNDDLGKRVSTTGARGYDRESNYYYLPVGLVTNKKITKTISIETTMEYDYLLWGKQKSHLEDFLIGFETLTNEQKNGYGLRGSLKVIKSSTSTDYFLEPYMRYWNIEDSDIQPIIFDGMPTGFVGWEPKNNTTEIGIRLGASF